MDSDTVAKAVLASLLPPDADPKPAAAPDGPLMPAALPVPVSRIDRTPHSHHESHSWQSPAEVHGATAAGAAASVATAPHAAPAPVPGRSGYGGSR